ncbi:zinc/manganese transport system substrate-binding protein [Labedaea rhizosphaerae]|uniref:Zinc/manganese transport system substrate-binding protein n=1 Tax=Labedaea rhizosphaerae TaxID=598644 RepID=A0A4R6SMW2_LABRH|nr:zinc/manganese transport system substrate-binding protein [Labedaea rhizosphaerae]
MRRWMTRTVTAFAVLSAAGFVATACNSAGGATPGADGKISVVASTDIWGSVAKAVGGDDVNVKALLADPAADPHAHEGDAAEATELDGAALIVYNGGGYDDFFADMVNAAAQDAHKVVAFDVSGHSEGDNEHVWYDLPTVKKVADKIAQELGAIAPDRKAAFDANAKTFDGKIDTLITAVSGIGKAHPGRKAVATEPVAKYLLDLAGVQDVTPEDFAEAIEQESDPSANAVSEITDLIAGKKVSVLINNVQTETTLTNTLVGEAQKADIAVVAVSETFPAGESDYVGWMTKQVNGLAAAVAKE